ncbi:MULTISPECIES: hypothetical protein [unclassified Mucilaginibacter]|uniref:hypothetical protein n=1 Tax=unclassified Mucilaginibacter TaxID=2617802 RepID=UPI0031F6AC84
MKIVVTQLKNVIVYSLLILATFSFSACSKKVAFINSTVVPAAEGKIDIDRDENKNYTIDIEVIRLADPSRLTPPKKTYVTWLETESEGTKNIGQLKSISGFFTNSLKATLRAVSPLKPKRVFITAEDDATAQSPGSQVVMTTKSF